MAVVLPEFTEGLRNEPAYDVYRGLSFAEDQERLAADQYQYDITIIMPGTIGKERKKTSGHSHPEVYEVIKGTAAYILQKSPDFAAAPQELVVDDLIVAVVKEGQSIIVPPNYGHCSINIGDGPLVFSNLAYKPCTVHYDTVQFYHGMACYIVEENGQLCVRKNHYYPRVPRIKFATVKENPHLGITFDMPLYQRYRAAPERFHFLGHVDNYVREIMGMLQYEDDLFPLCQEDA